MRGCNCVFSPGGFGNALKQTDMPDKQIFFDPQRKRWKRLRRILDVTAVITTLVLAGFIFNVLRTQRAARAAAARRPSTTTRPCAIARRARARPGPCAPPAARPRRKPSEIPFNTGEGLRAAYYAPDDAASYSSFKEHVHQIDMLFPQWLHVERAAGHADGHEPRQRPRVSAWSTAPRSTIPMS